MPNGTLPGPSVVRPAWFSKPTTVSGAPARSTADHDVADQARRTGDRVGIEDADARHPGAVDARVAVSGQLVSAADRQQHRPVGDGAVQRLGFGGGEVAGHDDLIPVLTAAEVVDVGVVRDRVADAGLDHLERVAAPVQPTPQHGDVAAVGIDVQLAGIEVADPDGAHATTRHR